MLLRSAAASLLVAAVFTTVSAQTPNVADAERLAKALQQEYNRVRDMRASFVQTQRGGALKVRTQGEGTVIVKKPGRMRWDYTKPEKQSIISDGRQLVSYYPDTKEVDIVDMPPEDETPTALLFLAGKGDILRDFRVTVIDSPIAGTSALRLDPKREEKDYQYLIVAFHPKTYQIRGLVSRDAQGSETTTQLRDIRENNGVPDSTFAFTPPRGAHVTRRGNSR